MAYNDKKEKIREEALEYQTSYAEGVQYSYGELAVIQDYFEKQGRRYGLLREFRENAII